MSTDINQINYLKHKIAAMTDATKKSTGGHEKEFKLVKDEERILEVRCECKGFSSWAVSESVLERKSVFIPSMGVGKGPSQAGEQPGE